MRFTDFSGVVGRYLWGQWTDGRCLLGYVIGLMSSTLKGPCNILKKTSKFARNMAKSSLGGEVYAPSEMADHTLLLKDCYGPFEGMNPGAAGLEDCECVFTTLNTQRKIAEEYSVRHFVSIQRAVGDGHLENAYWPPGTVNPADGHTKVRSDVAPPLRLPASGPSYPGQLRPLTGVAWKE